jgi:hypothetical protein
MNAGERSTIRAIRGPVTLITIGALFALNNFTPYRFDQTWPVILIVFGLLSLLGRSLDRVPPRPPFPPSGYQPPQPPFPPQGSYPGSSYAGSPYAQPPSGGTRGNEPGANPGGKV